MVLVSNFKVHKLKKFIPNYSVYNDNENLVGRMFWGPDSELVRLLILNMIFRFLAL